jgi:hypothetical protein
MITQRESEITLLKKKYGELEFGEYIDWILFKNIKIPGGWNMNQIDLLIVVPAGYPVTPPDNFYVPVGFRLSSGNTPANYSEPVQYLSKNWGQFSYHLEGNWCPKNDITSGDNLQSFMLRVFDRLGELN